jgi:hypothetical protein
VESGLWLRYVRNTAIAVVVLFQSKWRVQILCALRSGPVRLGQLARLALPQRVRDSRFHSVISIRPVRAC